MDRRSPLAGGRHNRRDVVSGSRRACENGALLLVDAAPRKEHIARASEPREGATRAARIAPDLDWADAPQGNSPREELPGDDDVTHDCGDDEHRREPDERHVRDERIDGARVLAERVNRWGGGERETEDHREQGDPERIPRDDEPPRCSPEPDQNRERDRCCSGNDIEVPSGERHLCGHQPVTRGLVHDQLERQAKPLHGDERSERKPTREAVARPREADRARDREDGEK